MFAEIKNHTMTTLRIELNIYVLSLRRKQREYCGYTFSILDEMRAISSLLDHVDHCELKLHIPSITKSSSQRSHAENRRSEIPLEDATENPSENSSENPLRK